MHILINYFVCVFLLKEFSVRLIIELFGLFWILNADIEPLYTSNLFSFYE